MVRMVALSGGFEFDLGLRGLYCSVPFLGAVWLGVEARHGGPVFIAERDSARLGGMGRTAPYRCGSQAPVGVLRHSEAGAGQQRGGG